MAVKFTRMKKQLVLPQEADTFRGIQDQLTNQVLHDVYYEYVVEDFENFRVDDRAEFEYVPLSKFCLETKAGQFFSFFDSTKFLEDHGFYTLDFQINEKLDFYFRGKSLKDDPKWTIYVNQTIQEVKIAWDKIGNKFANYGPPNIYPKYLELTFENQQQLFILAAEPTSYNEKKKYDFMLPDESIVLFFNEEGMRRHQLL